MPFDSIPRIRLNPRKVGAIQVLTALLLTLWAFHIIGGLQKKVDSSFRSFPSDTRNPDSMLNHANTYYWWGRYRNNTLPEFDTAGRLAGRALDLAAERYQQDGDTTAYRERERQARQMLSMVRLQSDICRYNIASHVPIYMEAMGFDQSFMQEDADADEISHVALRGAIGRLTELLSPSRTQPIESLSHFALVNTRTSNPMAEEMVVQELNNSTRLYTLSRHEMAKVLGRDTIDVAAVSRDTADLATLARAFSTDELALIDFTENDRVDGIYYYGMRLRLWSASNGMNPQNIYTEFMVRDRVFNQMRIFIIPFFLAFLLLAAALNLFVNAAAAWSGSFDAIHPLYVPICLTLGVAFHYGLTVFGLGIIAKPAPDAFYASDAAEIWNLAFPLTFLLPAILTYLVLGKMDNVISHFRSDLENPGALFALTAGTFMGAPFSLTYLHAIRFGSHLDLASLLPSLGAVLLIALLIARHGTAIVNFPERVHLAQRILRWLAVLTYLFIAYLMLKEWTLHYDVGHLRAWLFVYLLPSVAFMESAGWALPRYLRRKRIFKVEGTSDVKPEGLDGYGITVQGGRTLFREGSSGTVAAALYVNAQKGMPATEAVTQHFMLGKEQDIVHIDFHTEAPAGREVHYHPFALAFQYDLAFIKFNDAAETARKTSNLLGKLLSSITSIGGLIVDDRKAIARDPGEVAKMLLDAHAGKSVVWILDNVERIRDEDMVLLKSVVSEMKVRSERYRLQAEVSQPWMGVPLIVACGHGEYGHRERLMAMLKSLADNAQTGVLPYRMRYRDAAERILEGEAIPIQVRLHLEQLFRRENRDHGPVIVKQTLAALWNRGIIFRKEGVETCLARLDELKSLPDVSLGFPLPRELQVPGELRHALTAAAYLSDGDGRFHLPVIAHVLGFDRMTVLQHLKEAERLNLVYDLKGHSHFYWYSFTDRSLVAGLKELENPRQKEVSQLANEFYRGFVEYHSAIPEGGRSADRLISEHRSGRLDIETLAMVAERAHAVYPAFPSLAFDVNRTAAGILGGNGIARFEQALACTERALAIADSIPPTERHDMSQRLYDLLKLRFEMLLEIGGYRNADMDALLKKIQESPFHHNQEEANRWSFELSVAKFRFLRFKGDDPRLGEETCARVKAGSRDDVERLRAEFYSIKLVPSVHLIYGKHADWPVKAVETNARYKALLGELEKGYMASADMRELYRQVLNDYGGSFLTDKILPLTRMSVADAEVPKVQSFLENIGMGSPSEAFSLVERLLHRRIDMETERISGLREGRVTTLKDRLQELLSNEDPSIDKRGLCYTLNYLSRVYRTAADFNKSVETGLISYRFNTHVGDLTGCCVAAGTLGYSFAELGDDVQAYRWFERSFGHAWTIAHWSRSDMAMQMLRTAKSLKDPVRMRNATFHLQQIALLSACPYFPTGPTDGDVSDLLLSGSKALGQRVSADTADALLGPDPLRFVDKFKEWASTTGIQPGGSGKAKAPWLDDGQAFGWKAEPEIISSKGVFSMKLSIFEEGSGACYDLLLLRDVDPTRYIVHMEPPKKKV